MFVCGSSTGKLHATKTHALSMSLAMSLGHLSPDVRDTSLVWRPRVTVGAVSVALASLDVPVMRGRAVCRVAASTLAVLRVFIPVQE